MNSRASDARSEPRWPVALQMATVRASVDELERSRETGRPLLLEEPLADELELLATCLRRGS